MDEQEARARLEELRQELRAERISYGELAELQDLAEYIEPGDVELLEAAGVPEHESTAESMRKIGRAPMQPERLAHAYGETTAEEISARLTWLEGNYGAPIEEGIFPAIGVELSDEGGGFMPTGNAGLSVRYGDVQTILAALLHEGSPSSVALRVELLAALGIEES